MTMIRAMSLALAGLMAAALAETPAQATSDQRRTTLPIRGIVRPLNQAVISVDLPVRVAKLHVREAQAFRKGSVLVAFDCERLSAEHAALAAVHREMQLVLDSNTYLDKRGAIGKVDVEVSRSRVAKAEADAKGLAARLKQCSVVAPYDGRVTELRINEHEIPAGGQPFMSIVDETAFEIDLIVPSVWLRTLMPGARLSFTIDETGRSYQAAVSRIGAAVDPVSQTVKVIAEFAELDDRVLAGMSGTAKFAEGTSAK